MFRLIGLEGRILIEKQTGIYVAAEGEKLGEWASKPPKALHNNKNLGNRPQVITTRLNLPTLVTVLPKQDKCPFILLITLDRMDKVQDPFLEISLGKKGKTQLFFFLIILYCLLVFINCLFYVVRLILIKS